MIHIGTDRGRARTEAITPAADRSGPRRRLSDRAQPGDRGLRRPDLRARDGGDEQPAEPLLADAAERQLEGASHSPAAYRQAFRRAYLILHGGDVDAKLRRLGQPPVGRELAVNAAPALTVIWNPIAGLDARSPRPAQAFYPGDPYVDMVGNDMFASRAGVASHAANEALYRAHPGKPYALPEWGLSIDDPGFVEEDLRVPEDAAADEARRVLRREAGLCLRPRLEAGRAGRVPALHHAARREGERRPAGRRRVRSCG